MKITPTMYGRAAKCPACHQKWFVPRKDEIPTDGSSILLKERPELLRKAGERVRPLAPDESMTFDDEIFDAEIMSLDEPPQSSESQLSSGESAVEQALEGEADECAISSAPEAGPFNREDNVEEPPIASGKPKTPLDVLEPLRLLFSYHLELDKRKAANEAAGRGAEGERVVLEAYDRSIQRLWKKLHESLEAEYASCAKKITTIEETIARTSIALRVGDIALDAFLEKTNALRAQREALERQRYNLKAWREADTPELAGGLVDVVLEELDVDAFSLELPAPTMYFTDGVVYLVYGDALSEALRMRAAVERRRAEWQALANDQNLSQAAVAEGIAETKIVLDRMRARIRFYHERLERLLLDCDNDIQTLQSFQREVAERAGKGELSNGEKTTRNRQIQDAETGLIRARNLLRKTISANSPGEIPAPSPTLVRRIHGNADRNPLWENFLLTALYLVFMTSALVLLAGANRQGVKGDGLFVLLAACVASMGIVNTLVKASARGPYVLTLLIFQMALLFLYLYQLAVKGAFHERPAAFHGTGILLVLGMTAAGAFVFMALDSAMRERARLDFSRVITTLCIALFIGALVGGGYWWAGIYASMQDPRGPEVPDDVLAHGQPAHASPEVVVSPQPALRPVAPRDQERVPFETLPGEAAAPPEVTPTPGQEEIVQAEDQAEEGEAADAGAYPQPAVTHLLLNGVAHGDGPGPRFRATLFYSDGRSMPLTLQLGDVIYGEWKAAEYHVDSKKLTISNGERILILQAGGQVALE